MKKIGQVKDAALQHKIRQTEEFIMKSKDSLVLNVEFDIAKGGKRWKNIDRVHIGTNLVWNPQPKRCLASYFIALSHGTECKMKLHFDLDFDDAAAERKPSPHVQGLGRMWDQTYKCSWETDVDKPRVPCLPLCTPLLWHSAFCEFSTCDSVRGFLNQGWWRNLVRQAEEKLWGPFAADITSNLSKGCIIDFLYPKEKT
jgi:hypothetical protein